MNTLWFEAIACILILLFVQGQPSCVPPQPIFKQIAEDAKAETPVFTSMNAENTTYMFELDSQNGFGKGYFDEYFNYMHNGNTWTLVVSMPVDLDVIRKGDANGMLLNIDIFCVREMKNVTKSSSHMESYKRKIFVKNVDEFDPVFDITQPFSVPETARVNQIFLRLSNIFTDKDYTGKVSESTFSVTYYEGTSTDGNNVFSVEKTGEVILTRALDYEKGDKIFGITVIGHLQERSAKANIEFLVVNMNDNPPVFENLGCYDRCIEKSYSAQVLPSFIGVISGYNFGPILATDADGDSIEYSLVNGTTSDFSMYVEIDNHTGDLMIVKPVGDNNLELYVQAMSISILPMPENSTTASVIEAPVFIYIRGDKGMSVFTNGVVANSSVSGILLLAVSLSVLGHIYVC